MSTESVVRGFLGQAGIEVNGHNPWDPQIRSPSAYKAFERGSIGIGEAYMHGLWDCDDLAELFSRVTRAGLGYKLPWNWGTLGLLFRATFSDMQTKVKALRVGRIHYDIPTEVWEATLDTTMTGSCAYYRAPSLSLEDAQAAKKQLVFDKIGMKRGMSLLDIGVGWASFSGYAVEKYDARPVGVTVSSGQRDYIRRRFGAAIDVRVHDYRDLALARPVDRVISVEMFEQVGEKHLREFFEVARRSLRPDGLMLLHTITTPRYDKHLDPWMEKYIYPGGYLPTPGQICEAVEGLFHVEDVHDIGAHYDPTLLAWMAKFRKNWNEVKRLGPAALGMDPEVFCRMWLYHYLASAGGFRSRRISVHQFVLSPQGVPGGYVSVR